MLSMLICKDGDSDVYNNLMVDSWETFYEENKKNGQIKLIENFSGLTKIEKTQTQTYLVLLFQTLVIIWQT